MGPGVEHGVVSIARLIASFDGGQARGFAILVGDGGAPVEGWRTASGVRPVPRFGVLVGAGTGGWRCGVG